MAKILIADDSAFMRSVLRNILAKEGFADVEEAIDGEDALKKIENGAFDLLLLDIVMPNLDGIGVLKRLPFNKVKVIVISAVGQEKMMNDAKEAGAADFIIKPFEAENVLEAVKKILK